jgi:replicative DNA helicase
MQAHQEPVALPWSAEAEQSVLGGLMLDPDALARIADRKLTTGHFFNAAHGAIWGAVCELSARRQPIDLITVHQHLADTGKAQDCGGMAYLNDLAQSVPSAANIGRYADIVAEKAMLRGLAAAADQARAIALDPDGSAVDKLDRAAALFSNLRQVGRKAESQGLAELISARTVHWEALQRGEASSGIPTQLPALDEALGGGLKGGKVIVIAARPSVGKTSLASQIALAVAQQGHPVLILSQEMPAADLADRAVAHLGRVNLGALATGHMGEGDWGRITEALDLSMRLPLRIDDEPGLTLHAINAKARLMQQRYGLKLLVVDYLQLCAGTSPRDNRNQQIEEVSRGLKSLSKELDCTVLALAQLNRQAAKGAEPDLSDLRDSGAIEQDADTVLFLHPRERQGDGSLLVAALIAKNRQGRRGRFALSFYGATQRWDQTTADVSPPGHQR